ncbi:hypothetical protein K437DRAFT_40252 [Tilletiaria anomala UBC 951]|uniref:Uncharacterized protein n=1 Tax=Tilletiaria anomala (strain ATCC 24038 / CBS 436.72 / UBC 951) TaxID=1037660 RepID=A0A066WDS6_TILAU|nr:uncharacterized protein K437DRAFT_40252 [Tilletiaria anomala UBC 951]KDN52107.1 hypothetical protein K437DRAFT_40252 [Tilletiaria anomala UBC 951]
MLGFKSLKKKASKSSVKNVAAAATQVQIQAHAHANVHGGGQIYHIGRDAETDIVSSDRLMPSQRPAAAQQPGCVDEESAPSAVAGTGTKVRAAVAQVQASRLVGAQVQPTSTPAPRQQCAAATAKVAPRTPQMAIITLTDDAPSFSLRDGSAKRLMRRLSRQNMVFKKHGKDKSGAAAKASPAQRSPLLHAAPMVQQNIASQVASLHDSDNDSSIPSIAICPSPPVCSPLAEHVRALDEAQYDSSGSATSNESSFIVPVTFTAKHALLDADDAAACSPHRAAGSRVAQGESPGDLPHCAPPIDVGDGDEAATPSHVFAPPQVTVVERDDQAVAWITHSTPPLSPDLSYSSYVHTHSHSQCHPHPHHQEQGRRTLERRDSDETEHEARTPHDGGCLPLPPVCDSASETAMDDSAIALVHGETLRAGPEDACLSPSRIHGLGLQLHAEPIIDAALTRRERKAGEQHTLPLELPFNASEPQAMLQGLEPHVTPSQPSADSCVTAGEAAGARAHTRSRSRSHSHRYQQHDSKFSECSIVTTSSSSPFAGSTVASTTGADGGQGGVCSSSIVSMSSMSLARMRADFPSPPDRACMAVNALIHNVAAVASAGATASAGAACELANSRDGMDTLPLQAQYEHVCRTQTQAHAQMQQVEEAQMQIHHAYREAFNRKGYECQKVHTFHLAEISEASTIASRRKASLPTSDQDDTASAAAEATPTQAQGKFDRANCLVAGSGAPSAAAAANGILSPFEQLRIGLAAYSFADSEADATAKRQKSPSWLLSSPKEPKRSATKGSVPSSMGYRSTPSFTEQQSGTRLSLRYLRNGKPLHISTGTRSPSAAALNRISASMAGWADKTGNKGYRSANSPTTFPQTAHFASDAIAGPARALQDITQMTDALAHVPRLPSSAPRCAHPPEMACMVQGGCGLASAFQPIRFQPVRRDSDAESVAPSFQISKKTFLGGIRRSKSTPSLAKAARKLSPRWERDDVRPPPLCLPTTDGERAVVETQGGFFPPPPSAEMDTKPANGSTSCHLLRSTASLSAMREFAKRTASGGKSRSASPTGSLGSLESFVALSPAVLDAADTSLSADTLPDLSWGDVLMQASQDLHSTDTKCHEWRSKIPIRASPDTLVSQSAYIAKNECKDMSASPLPSPGFNFSRPISRRPSRQFE